MARETQRRLAVLAVVGVLAVVWAAGVTGTRVTALASAAPVPQHRHGVASPLARCPFPGGLRAAFESAARDASIPPGMLWAVAKVESNLRADAQSEAGARGLLQVMPATGRSLALNIAEPRSNVLAGARYLRQLLDRFGASDLALAAYNAGPTAVDAAGAAPSADVQRYVSNVNALWNTVAGCR
jgi:soluble lytic murein transglycosylase-like protein